MGNRDHLLEDFKKENNVINYNYLKRNVGDSVEDRVEKEENRKQGERARK